METTFEQQQQLYNSLSELIRLKEWKDIFGKDNHYNNMHSKVWKNAEVSLNNMHTTFSNNEYPIISIKIGNSSNEIIKNVNLLSTTQSEFIKSVRKTSILFNFDKSVIINRTAIISHNNLQLLKNYKFNFKNTISRCFDCYVDPKYASHQTDIHYDYNLSDTTALIVDELLPKTILTINFYVKQMPC